ncbi:ATP-binding protein [Acidomonas methanolica]|uniref:histidine kinase n=1 Tax=Acidomonas methanolica NBRC 104435 TaxID=1231351 RepID=A0A023D3B7_ACIMT|nr:ATP-binding protein [Acidomonas methanolica]MBU2655181.1 HAMP domain-containing protein [Acidomonas methanolica]TCS24708.1 hypothetical protein EDC31_12218 [Acidomonas methanolica]GAJ28235.1 two component sensor histidine kinase EnvZ [Acidomonas methanolica NBRC 104435]GBQ58996.1 two component sensor histidine kinase [Acidomonas methanolica]GEK98772.1 hypothetical protein AME01nite_12710 [Acidomonas methanolica NBRC 104435]
MAWRLYPNSLRARTGLLLIVGLCIVQVAGLTIHALDHLDIERRITLREDEHHAFAIYRALAELPPAARAGAIRSLNIPSGFSVTVTDKPDHTLLGHEVPMPAVLPRLFRVAPFGSFGGSTPGARPPGGRPPPMERPFPPPPYPRRNMEPLPSILHNAMLPPRLYPARLIIGHNPASRHWVFSILTPDEADWVIVKYIAQRPNPFDSPTFLIAFALMTLCGGGLILWGTQRLIAPLGTLVSAADALGKDVNAPPLPEGGPTELRRAAQAFNTMAANVRRLINDRVLMLTAIGHDLRTPITRLKLRSEFIEDDELRDKFLADLDEMEAMVAAMLEFGRDTANREPKVRLDLSALLSTVADEAAESMPHLAEHITLDTPDHPVLVAARSLPLKRALMNLVINALKYGGSAHITLRTPTDDAMTTIVIEDDGPGLPDKELERMFEPFVRAESSRNRETGGTGLGLAIARSVLRGHGGDIRLANRPSGGLRAVVTLPT